jgi:hypothetical protein
MNHDPLKHPNQRLVSMNAYEGPKFEDKLGEDVQEGTRLILELDKKLK